MKDEPLSPSQERGGAPDMVFIDVILLAYRLGKMRYDEQRAILIAAARTAADALLFMKAIEERGIDRRSQLHGFVGEVLAAPDYFRAQYPQMLGLRREGEEAESFLCSPMPLYLSEAVLTTKQQKVFYDAYWWFVGNHQEVFVDPRKGNRIGAWATDPKDNASVVPRFEKYLAGLIHHSTQWVRTRFEGFPDDIVLAILRRAFLGE